MSLTSKWRWAYRGFFVVVILAVLIGLVLPAGQVFRWVGSKDLEIEFVVKDVDTGQPVPGARIEILYEETNFCANRGQAPFAMLANAEGVAKHFSKECMCFGTKGMGKDTFAIHIPGWLIQISAEGHESTEPFFLDTADYRRLVVRGKETASLRVVKELKSR